MIIQRFPQVILEVNYRKRNVVIFQWNSYPEMLPIFQKRKVDLNIVFHWHNGWTASMWSCGNNKRSFGNETKGFLQDHDVNYNAYGNLVVRILSVNTNAPIPSSPTGQ